MILAGHPQCIYLSKLLAKYGQSEPVIHAGWFRTGTHQELHHEAVSVVLKKVHRFSYCFIFQPLFNEMIKRATRH